MRARTGPGFPILFKISAEDRLPGGLTLDDITRGGYGPDRIPELVRHNFSMAPRGAILPPGLPSLGYRINRKSEVWSDLATVLYEEGKSRRWAPARDIPWSSLDASGLSEQEELAWRQLATTLCSIGLVAADVPARWVWLMNQEFHEVKDRKSTRLNSSHMSESRMPSSA